MAEDGHKMENLMIADLRLWIADAIMTAATSINNAEAIKKSFLDNGLSNAFNGSQEHLVHTAKFFVPE